MGDYAKAEPLIQRALKIKEKAVGPEHPNTATSLNNFAALYRRMGDYAKAEPLYQRVKIREKTLGSERPDTATSLENLSLLMLDAGRRAEATQRAKQAQQAGLTTLANILSFASEPQR